jgi:hypothetical protein
MIDKLVTGKGSFSEIMMGMLEDIGKAVLHSFIDPFAKAIENFLATAIADLLGGKGLGGVLDSIKSIGSSIASLFKGGASVAEAAGGAAEAAGGAAEGAAGAAGTAVSAGISSVAGIVTGAISAITGVIGVFQSARQETTLNAIEHNTRYTMMYVGERADGGILGVSFRILDALLFGNLVVAIEDHRNKFYDWTGVITPIVDDARNIAANILSTLADLGVYIADMKDAAVATAHNTASIDRNLVTGLQTLNVSVIATGVTTEQAAKALGNQIAAALSRQLVPAS